MSRRLRPEPNTGKYTVQRIGRGKRETVEDSVAAEEPLEIRVIRHDGGQSVQQSLVVTMRTPGDDFELAAGFLYNEGVVQRREDILDIAYCLDEAQPQERNVVSVTLGPDAKLDPTRLDRNFFASSSCGVCGKATLESLELRGQSLVEGGPLFSERVLKTLPAAMRERQLTFQQTGGLHASALFDSQANLIDLREDIGRHNTVDKLVGERLMKGELPLSESGLVVSGRAGFEILQKTLAARVPLVAAVGAPSTLAVDVATEFGITLIGFLNADGFNVYSRPDRIAGQA
jgi:FdhD protein